MKGGNSLLGHSKGNLTKTTAYSSVPGGETTQYPVSETTGDILSFPHNYNDSKAHEVHFSDGQVYRAE